MYVIKHVLEKGVYIIMPAHKFWDNALTSIPKYLYNVYLQQRQ